MKLLIQYGTGAAVIPAAAIETASRATETDLRILLISASLGGYDTDAVCEKLNISAADADASAAFWRGAGIFVPESAQSAVLPQNTVLPQGAPAVDTAEAPAKSPARATLSLPAYTSDDIARFMEANASERIFLNECQQELGKVFNVAETGIVVGLRDHLGLSCEYILLLISHCAKKGKRSLRYIETMALDLFDRQITGYSELEAHLHRVEALDEVIPRLREMLGIKKRALSAKEREFFNRWINEWQWDFETVTLAYEITVDKTGSAALPYMNKILENWYSAGCRSLDDVRAELDKYAKSKEETAGQQSTFDTDDFFEAALRRSMEAFKAEQNTETEG